LTTLSINKKNKKDKLSDKAQNNIQISSINSLNFTSPDYLDEMPSKPITIEDKSSESIQMTVVDEDKENAKVSNQSLQVTNPKHKHVQQESKASTSDKDEKSGDINPF
jgi:hypothetical protein